MKNNIKLIVFIIIAVIALYFTKNKYESHSKNKSISACVIAQKKYKNMSSNEAKKYCINQINKNLQK